MYTSSFLLRMLEARQSQTLRGRVPNESRPGYRCLFRGLVRRKAPGSVVGGRGRFREVADEMGAEELEPGALGVADMAARRGLRPVGIALGYRLHDILMLGMRHRKPVRHSQ